MGKRQIYLIFPLSFNIILQALDNVVRRREKGKGGQYWGGEKERCLLSHTICKKVKIHHRYISAKVEIIKVYKIYTSRGKQEKFFVTTDKIKISYI